MAYNPGGKERVVAARIVKDALEDRRRLSAGIARRGPEVAPLVFGGRLRFDSVEKLQGCDAGDTLIHSHHRIASGKAWNASKVASASGARSRHRQ
jgi:hypothetical protein